MEQRIERIEGTGEDIGSHCRAALTKLNQEGWKVTLMSSSEDRGSFNVFFVCERQPKSE